MVRRGGAQRAGPNGDQSTSALASRPVQGPGRAGGALRDGARSPMSPVTNMISCRELVELVTDYLEDQLDPRQRARFEEHLGACEACITYLDQMRMTIDALGHIPPESLSPDAESELLAAFRDWRHSA